MIVASGEAPRWHLRGQRVHNDPAAWLERIEAGGGTPLRLSLQQADDWLSKRKRRNLAEHQRLFLLTDARVNPLPTLSLHPLEQRLLIDIEAGSLRFGKARQLAAQIGADYVHVDDIPTLNFE